MVSDKPKSHWHLFLILGLILISFLPPIDTDLGWHLRYGDYFWQNGRILRNNLLTYLSFNYFWPNSYTLYQIIISLIYRFFGLFGLSLLMSLVILTAFLIFNTTFNKSSRFNFLLFLSALLFGRNVFVLGIRAQIFSFLLIIYLNFILTRLKAKADFHALPLIVLLFLFWVNTHGAFILGFVLLFSRLLDFIIHKNWRNSFIIASSILLSFMVTFINPYGIKIYAEVLRHAAVPLKLLIAEWVEPNLIYKLLMGLMLVFFYISFYLNGFKKHIYTAFLLTVFSYLAFDAKRNLAYVALAYIFSLYSLYYPSFRRLNSHPVVIKLTNFSAFFIILYGAAINIPKTVVFSSDPKAICNQSAIIYPCKAIEYIQKNKIEGKNVFSSYEWGGFLSWRLPDYLFFVDGRTPAWPTPEGKSPYTIYLEIIQAAPDYQTQLNKYHTDWLLVPANTFLDAELHQKTNSAWKEIYRDEISSIYIKSL